MANGLGNLNTPFTNQFVSDAFVGDPSTQVAPSAPIAPNGVPGNIFNGGSPRVAPGGDSPLSGLGGYLGGIKALTGLGNLALGFKQYGLAKDTLSHNIANSRKNFEANRTKYNNAVARTEAVNKHFGSQNVASRI